MWNCKHENLIDNINNNIGQPIKYNMSFVPEEWALCRSRMPGRMFRCKLSLK